MPKPEAEKKPVAVDYRAVEGLADTEFRSLALQAAELKGTIRECNRRLDGYDHIVDGKTVHEDGLVEQIRFIAEALEAPGTVDVEGKIGVIQVPEGKPGKKLNVQKLILRMKGKLTMADVEACMDKTAGRKAHLRFVLPGEEAAPEVV